MSATPGALADALAALPVFVSSVSVRRSTVPIDDYAGGARPSSVVCLSGRGHLGHGENVAFTEDEHAQFAAGAAALLVGPADARTGRVGALIHPAASGHGRAAVEAALIDLGLRQVGTTLAELTGVARAALRVVISFAACAAPAARVRQLRARGRGEDLKIDVDPAWGRDAQAALASEAGVAILDFKGRGDARLASQLSTLFPAAIFEDPPAGTAHARIARDAPLTDARAVAAALGRQEAVNIKAPRMGGPLEALRGLDLAMRAGITAYLGGMFEVGVGRRQARQLAALFCPTAPNDLAPFIESASAAGGGNRAGTWAPIIRLDTLGFG